MKYIVKIKLTIIGVNLQNGSMYFVGNDNGNQPEILLTDKSIYHTLTELFEQCVDLDIAWVNPELYEVSTINENLYIVYKCMIPLETKLNHGYNWVQASKHLVA